MADSRKVDRSSSPVWLAWIWTVACTSAAVGFGFSRGIAHWEPEAIGTFAGAWASALAFGWLVAGFYLQRQELTLNTQEIGLLVEQAKLQAAAAKSMLELEAERQRRADEPEFALRIVRDPDKLHAELALEVGNAHAHLVQVDGGGCIEFAAPVAMRQVLKKFDHTWLIAIRNVSAPGIVRISFATPAGENRFVEFDVHPDQTISQRVPNQLAASMASYREFARKVQVGGGRDAGNNA